LNKNASEEVANATLTDTHRGVGIIVDNSDGDEGDPTRPRGRKRRISDKENGERKKTKVSMPMFMINSLTSQFCTERNGLAYQDSSWGEKVNSENICENHLAIGR